MMGNLGPLGANFSREGREAVVSFGLRRLFV